MKKKSALHWGAAGEGKTEYHFREHMVSSLYSFAAEALMLFSALFMWYDVFGGVTLSGRMTAALLAALFAGAVVGRLPFRWVAPAVTVIFAGLLSQYFVAGIFAEGLRESWLLLEDGWLYLGNAYLEKFNYYYQTLIVLETGREDMAQTSLFAALLLAEGLLFILSGGGKRKGVWLLLPAVVVSAELLVGTSPQTGGIVLFVFGVIFLRLEGWERGSAGKRDRRRMGKRDRRAVFVTRAAALAIAGAVVVLALTAGRFPAKALAENGWRVKTYQRFMENRLSELSFSNLYSGTKTVDNRKPQYDGDTALTLSLDQPLSQNLYLRDFYGTDYDGGRWVCGTSEFVTACKAAGFDPEEVSEGLFSDAFVRLSSGENDSGAAWIEAQIAYEGFGTSAALPYLSGLPTEGGCTLYGDAGAQKKYFENALSVEFAQIDPWDLNQLLTLAEDTGQAEFFAWYNSYALVYAEASEESPQAAEWAKEILETRSLGNIWLYFPSDDDSMGNLSSVSLDVTAWDGSITGALQADEPWERNLGRLYAAECVRTALEETCSYGLSLPDAGDADCVEFFLSESHLGYCKHFASAGALILRQMGVPARYATGYIVKQNSPVSNPDGGYAVTVQDRSAHAWVEIYLDNIGWVPVEMTPGYGSSSASLPTDEDSAAWEEPDTQEETAESEQEESESTQEEAVKEDTESESSEIVREEETETGQEPDSQASGNAQADGQSGAPESQAGGSGSTAGKRTLFILLTVCFLALLVTAAVLLIQRRIRADRQLLLRDIRHGRYARAIRRINRRIFFGLCRQKKSGLSGLRDAEYERALAEGYPQIERQDWKRYMEIVRRAAFSNERMCREEAQFSWRIYCGLRKRKK